MFWVLGAEVIRLLFSPNHVAVPCWLLRTSDLPPLNGMPAAGLCEFVESTSASEAADRLAALDSPRRAEPSSLMSFDRHNSDAGRRLRQHDRVFRSLAERYQGIADNTRALPPLLPAVCAALGMRGAVGCSGHVHNGR